MLDSKDKVRHVKLVPTDKPDMIVNRYGTSRFRDKSMIEMRFREPSHFDLSLVERWMSFILYIDLCTLASTGGVRLR